jgi:hypothetical protein
MNSINKKGAQGIYDNVFSLPPPIVSQRERVTVSDDDD